MALLTSIAQLVALTVFLASLIFSSALLVALVLSTIAGALS